MSLARDKLKIKHLKATINYLISIYYEWFEISSVIDVVRSLNQIIWPELILFFYCC